jgi:hypothetical protein
LYETQSIRSGLRMPSFWMFKWLVHVNNTIQGPCTHECWHKLQEYFLIFCFTT